ncbi:MAG: OmpA family protein [Chitinophagaceae bacterium]|nr:OmpA family protein [Chitinophagaceae bacterium]
MLQKITLSSLLAFIVLFTSCVSTKKYKAATTEAQNAKNSYDSLAKKHSELQSQLNDAIAGNKMLADERDRYQKEGEAAKADLKQMQGAVDEYVGSMEDVQKKVADRLADYTDRGVDVQYKDGAVHVGIQDDLLYNKGTNKVSKTGETVLGSLSSVLNENPNLKIVVLSHTDDRAKDSWSASTERSNNVVRMLKNNKIDPNRLTSAGQGQYNAIADNSTPEGRAQNRRTEIILVPETFKLLNK